MTPPPKKGRAGRRGANAPAVSVCGKGAHRGYATANTPNLGVPRAVWEGLLLSASRREVRCACRDTKLRAGRRPAPGIQAFGNGRPWSRGGRPRCRPHCESGDGGTRGRSHARAPRRSRQVPRVGVSLPTGPDRLGPPRFSLRGCHAAPRPVHFGCCRCGPLRRVRPTHATPRERAPRGDEVTRNIILVGTGCQAGCRGLPGGPAGD